MQEDTIFIFLVSVLIIGALAIATIMFTKKGGMQLDVDKYRLKWMGIEKQLSKDDQSGCVLAVLNADKLLDQALRDRGIRGQTMGERMKSAKNMWTNANAVWGAHKLRNQIAHESDHHLSYEDARRAIAGFKQALKDVGAI